MKYEINSEEEGEVIARLAADWADKRKCRLESELPEDNDGMSDTYKIVSQEKWDKFWEEWQADFEAALPTWLYDFEIVLTDSEDYDPDEDDDDVEIGDADDLYDDAYDALVADPDEGDDSGIIAELVKRGAIKLVRPRQYKMVNGGKIVPANYVVKREMRQINGQWYCHEEWVAPETKTDTAQAVATPISEYKPETYKGVITSE